MRKSIQYIVFLLYCLLILPILHAQEGLVRKQEFPGKSRNSGVGFAIKNYGYLIGGRTYPGYFNDFWRYSPDSDLWVQKADFPGEARWGAFCATSGSKAYYGLGYKNTINNYHYDFWKYDTDSDTWTRLKDFPGVGRFWAISFVINNKIYLGTGGTVGADLNDFWEYNIDSNTWLKKQNFPGPARMQAAAYALNNKGFITGGWGTKLNKADFWEYHPDSDAWIQMPDVGTEKIYGGFSFVLDSIPYLGLGINNHLSYHYSADSTWHPLPDFNQFNYRKNVISFCIGNKVYFGTGEDRNNNNYNDFWSYSPIPVGLNPNQQPNLGWKVYPNPSHGTFRLQFNQPPRFDVNIEVCNPLGEQVYKNKLNNIDNPATIDLHPSAIIPGIYFIKIFTADSSKVERLVIW
jgi:N-acetylneuraminic acid mutarotase